MKFNRRTILGGLFAAPITAKGVVSGISDESLYLNGGKAIGLAVGPSAPDNCAPAPHKFTNFADWFKVFGEESSRDYTRRVSGFDPDLLSMRLPLATKVRIQRQRDIARELERQKEWFEKQISLKGVVEWWP